MARRPFSRSAATFSPLVLSPKRSVEISGLRAASRVLITNTLEKPSASALSTRSTSGRTFRYVAVSAGEHRRR